VIDLATESLLSLGQATRLLPAGRGDAPTTLACVLRWILKGARAPSGERVRLDAVRLGGRWLTSREALQRFAEALTPALDESGPAATVRTPTKRERAAERAARELERVGI
jgi:hypothetical protein